MGPLFGAKQAMFKAFSHNYKAKTGVGVDHQHTTNDFCIAPRLAESGAHSMDGLITTDGLLQEPSAQVQHATNDFGIAPRLAESRAHSMDGLITMDGLMKEPSAQFPHAANDFCIAPRLAESGAHSMDSLMKKTSAQMCGPSIMLRTDGTLFWCQTGHVQGIFA